MGRSGLAVALVCALTLCAPSVPAQDCSGDPGYALGLPTSVEIGEGFLTCMTAPPGYMAILLVALDTGPTNTKFGPLCLGFPFAGIISMTIPPSGTLCFSHVVECYPPIVGTTAYFQFVAVDPTDTSVGGRSNMAPLTADDGDCELDPGDFYSFTQGGWGQDCSGGADGFPGCFRDLHFDSVFPNGMTLGDPDGPDGDGVYSLVLETSQAVADLLPNGSTPGPLTADEVNPLVSSAGVLAGQLVAAKLNVAFDDAGVFDGLKNNTVIKTGDLVFVGCVPVYLLGRTVRQVIAVTDGYIAGNVFLPPGVTASDLGAALDVVNNNSVDGEAALGCLELQL